MSTPYSPVTQFISARSSGSAASVVTAATTTTNGNSFIVIVGSSNASLISASPVSDSKGNTWTSANATGGGTQPGVSMFYVRNGTGGASHTFTFTPSSSAFIWIVVLEIPDLASSPVDGTNKTTANTTTHASGNITSSAVAMWVGAGSIDAISELTPQSATPFLAVVGQPATASVEGVIVAVRMVGSGVTAGFTYTTGLSANREAMVTGFKITPTVSSTGGAWAFAG